MAFGQHRAAGADADQIGRGAVALDDLEGYAAQNARHPHGIENLASFDQVCVGGAGEASCSNSPALGAGGAGLDRR